MAATTPVAAPTRLTLGQSRKVGLGAPLTAAPATAAPISAAGDEAPTPLPLRVDIQRKPESEASRQTPAIASMAPVKARPIEPLTTETPGAAAAAPMPAAPLLAARPLRTRLQRAPLRATRSRPSPNGADSDYRGAPVAAGPVKVHRGTVASELAESLEAKAFTHQGEIYLPSSAGPMGSPAARALIAHEMTHVAQQRTYGSRLPPEHTSHGQELEHRAAAAEKHPELPLAQPPPRGSQSAEQGSEERATAQRKPAGGARPPSPIVETTTINFPAGVQRAAEDKRADKTTAKRTTSEGNGKKSETELEELAGQLYSRISRRLRRELLVDRERAGLMVDLP